MPNVPLSIANWALNVHKGVETELRSIAIWNNEVLYASLISMYACLL